MPLCDLLPMLQQRIVERTTYFGVQAFRTPIDFWIYQELFCELRPLGP